MNKKCLTPKCSEFFKPQIFNLSNKTIPIAMVFLIIMLPICFSYQITYDANGNVEWTEKDNTFREYNSENRLWKVYDGANTSGILREEYEYDLTGERVLLKKSYNATGNWTQTTIYVDDNWIRVKNASGSYDELYVKHEGQLAAQVIDNVTEHIHPDHLGSSTVVTNESGNVIERTSYTPYGVVLEGGRRSRYSYEGKEHKENTGSIPSGELAYFDFSDLEDNGYNGTVYGASIVNGKIGNGYEFDADNDYIDFGNEFDIDSQDSFAYSAWIYADNDLTERGIIFGQDYRVGETFSLETDGKIRLRLDESPLTSDGSITWGQWNHVVVVYTYDSGNGGMDSTVAIYINRQLDKETNPIWDGGVFDSWTTGTRRVGKETAFDYHFKGEIDELGIWKKALSSSGVSELYDYGPPESTFDFHFRQYNAEWGVFTQPDSLLPNVYDPQTLNRYSFERSNPYRYTDPDGHLIEEIAVAGILLIVFTIHVLKHKEGIYRGADDDTYISETNNYKSIEKNSNTDKEIIKTKALQNTNSKVLEEIIKNKGEDETTTKYYKIAKNKLLDQFNIIYSSKMLNTISSRDTKSSGSSTGIRQVEGEERYVCSNCDDEGYAPGQNPNN